jgi:hypothetical protein
MIRRSSIAWLPAAALLLGLAAAPVTHVHDVGADADHQHGTARVHSHASGHHDHHAPPPHEQDSRPDRVEAWTIEVAGTTAGAIAQPPSPAVDARAIPHPIVEDRVRIVDLAQARAHDPPLAGSSSLRAPPLPLPVLS